MANERRPGSPRLVRKGEKGRMAVYAGTIRRAETAAVIGAESETRIPFMKS
jgi:hypothetical protein